MKAFKPLVIAGLLSLVGIMSYGLSHLARGSKFHGLVNDAIRTLQEISPMVESRNEMLSRAKYTQAGYSQMIAKVNQEIMDKLQKTQELINTAMTEVSMG